MKDTRVFTSSILTPIKIICKGSPQKERNIISGLLLLCCFKTRSLSLYKADASGSSAITECSTRKQNKTTTKKHFDLHMMQTHCINYKGFLAPIYLIEANLSS